MRTRFLALPRIEQCLAEESLRLLLALSIAADLHFKAKQRGDHLEIAHLAIDLPRPSQSPRLLWVLLERLLIVGHGPIFAQEELLTEFTKLKERCRPVLLALDPLDLFFEFFKQTTPNTRVAKPLRYLMPKLLEQATLIAFSKGNGWLKAAPFISRAATTINRKPARRRRVTSVADPKNRG